MKEAILTSIFILASAAWAEPQTIIARVYTNFVNPEVSRFGALVDVQNGEIIYVNSLISVLAPKDLSRHCIYEFNYVIDSSTAYKSIRILPPMKTLSCNHQFPNDK